MADIICDGKTTRDINSEIKRLIANGETDIRMKNPVARHNLGVAILQSVKLTFDGSVGYYCAGMVDGPAVEVKGSAGWGLAESMMGGTLPLKGMQATERQLRFEAERLWFTVMRLRG